jgi:hypothetical protein
MRHLLMLAAATSLAACAAPPRVWDKEGATPQTARIDLVECRRAARQEAFYEVPYWGIGGFSRFGPYYGYRPIRPYWGGADLRYDREIRLTAFCMRTKGYELVTLPPGPTVKPGIVPAPPSDAPPPPPPPAHD